MAQIPSYPASTPVAHPHPTPSRAPNLHTSDDLLLNNANLVAENERLEGELGDLYTRFNDMVNASAAKDRHHEDALRHLAIAAQQDTLRHQQEVADLTRRQEVELNAKQDKAVRDMLGLMQELDSVKTQMKEEAAEHRCYNVSLKSRLDAKIANEARLAEQLHDAKDDLHREHARNKAALGKSEAQLKTLRNQLASQVEEVNLSEFRIQKLEWQLAA
jgi:chromosome segregation ATPase